MQAAAFARELTNCLKQNFNDDLKEVVLAIKQLSIQQYVEVPEGGQIYQILSEALFFKPKDFDALKADLETMHFTIQLTNTFVDLHAVIDRQYADLRTMSVDHTGQGIGMSGETWQNTRTEGYFQSAIGAIYDYYQGKEIPAENGWGNLTTFLHLGQIQK